MSDSRVKVTLPPDDRDKEYSFPGKKEGAVEKYQIYRMKAEELKELCVAHKHLVGGKKAILQERLRKFSGEPELWDSIKPGARRALRGPRKNSGKAPKTGYQKRRLALIANTEPQPEFKDISDQCEEKKGREILEWARAYVKSHPEIQQQSPPLPPGYRPFNKVVDARTISNKLDGISTTLNHLVTGHVISAVPQDGSTSTSTTSSASPPSHVVISDVAQPSVSLPPIISFSPRAPLPSTVMPSSTTALSSMPAIPAPSATSSSHIGPTTIEVEETKTLKLASGETVRFKLSEIPDPNVLSFSSDIARLGRQWSDDHPHFDRRDCEVVIQGHGIALKYWPEVFGVKRRGSPDKRWGALKSRHNEWKFVAEEYLKFKTDKEFWAEYSNHKRKDGRMTFTEIASALRECRKRAKD